MRLPAPRLWLAVLSCLLSVGLSGCLGISLPTQQQPICSWNNLPPKNAGALCAETFKTLRALAGTEMKGDDRVVHRLVHNQTVAQRIIKYGRDERSNGLKWIHVVPSIEIDNVRPGYVGAGFYLVGIDGSGKINDPETLYLHVRHGSTVVVGDQPGQNW